MLGMFKYKNIDINPTEEIYSRWFAYTDFNIVYKSGIIYKQSDKYFKFEKDTIVRLGTSPIYWELFLCLKQKISNVGNNYRRYKHVFNNYSFFRNPKFFIDMLRGGRLKK